MNNCEPIVSIICTAYNHEPYIAKALEGFLIQQTTFPFEIIVSDDASTDKTADIIRRYENGHPALFKTFYHAENQYSRHIPFFFIELLAGARGEYIALCEGDDYWTDPNKLQKQVDFLKFNPEYGLVHTDFDIFYQNIGTLKLRSAFRTQLNSHENMFEKILLGNNIATLTVMYRKDLLKMIDYEQMKLFKMGDKFLWLEIARQSKIGYINESTAVYRIHSDSLSNCSGGPQRIDFISSSYNLNYYFIDKYGCSLETQEKVFRKAINTWFSLNEKECFNESYNRLLNAGRIKISDKFKHIAINNLIISLMYRLYKNTKISLKKLKNGIQK